MEHRVRPNTCACLKAEENDRFSLQRYSFIHWLILFGDF